MIEYSIQNHNHKLGRVENFFEINNNIFCLVREFEKSSFIIDKENNENNKMLDSFFIMVKLSTSFNIVPIENIQRKCILINCDGNSFLTYCVDLNEHD